MLEGAIALKIKAALGLILHGLFYGIGLAFAFWLLAKMTAHVDYYGLHLWKKDRNKFWEEIKEEWYFPSMFGPLTPKEQPEKP
jgi:hypothetical protein